MFDLKSILKDKNLSDMMRQYIECKLKYDDCVLLYRIGDFYEMFFNDALEVSNKLEITLTSKVCGLEEKAPMCGIPHHSLNIYIPKFIDNGFKIAIAEQLSDPKESKGIIERDVVKIITPGTIQDDIGKNDSNYLMAIFKDEDNVGISYIDINQGDIYLTSTSFDFLVEELSKVRPTEIIVNDSSIKLDILDIIEEYSIYCNDLFEESLLEESSIDKFFNKNYIDSLEIRNDSSKIKSLAILLNYVLFTQRKESIPNINNIYTYDIDKYMLIDSFTRDSLELVQNKCGSRENTLFEILNLTSTAQGARLLKQYINEPLVEKDKINNKLNIVEDLLKDNLLRENLSKALKEVYDLERICTKLSYEKINAKELINLKKSLASIPLIKHLIEESNSSYLRKYIKNLDCLEDIHTILEETILEEPSISITEGNIIKPSYNKTLEKYLDTLNHINDKILELEEEQKVLLGTRFLKIKSNDVDGYFMEVTKKSIEGKDIPEDYKKIKDLVNAYRYTFPKLRDLELNYYEALNKSSLLEYNLFVNIRNKIVSNVGRIKNASKILSNIDVFTSLGEVAFRNNYCKPTISEDNTINLKNSRHPIIENNVISFVANDLYMDENLEQIHILTGPNMSGKSTFMRQVVLINLMAQIGSFVPCDEALIPIRDRIFTRIGASDNLSKGQSTFMVEMNEVSKILNHATSKSLIILDEVGRGTSTYDGISLASSIVEYIIRHIRCHTLFATHYLELTSLENKYQCVKNYTIDIKEDGDEIVFLRKIIKGCANKSYGIYVAELANLPSEVIDKAKDILKTLENNKSSNCQGENDLEKELLGLDLMNMNPMEAFNYLYNLQNRLKK